jgi:uncharacterized protein YraI
MRLTQRVSLAILAGGAVMLALVAQASAAAPGGPPAQVAPSPTPIGGQIALPTPTATIPGGATATPSRTPSPSPVLAEAIGEANLRSGPGLDFDIVGVLVAGNPVPVIGRSVRFPWYVVEWEEGPGGQAWVFEQLVTIIGDITTVPIVEEPAAPTIDPSLAAIQATATIVLQTPGAAETATAEALRLPTGVYTPTPGGPAGAPGSLPTFTPPPPYVQPTLLPAVDASEQRGLPPAVLVISLAGLGFMSLVLAALRRL